LSASVSGMLDMVSAPCCISRPCSSCGERGDLPTAKWRQRLVQFAERISGRACPGNLAFSASWYLPGDHSLPHTDAIAHAAEHNRQVAFVWHLSRDWRSEWGGALFWCPTSLYLAPEFNTLVLFNVGPDTHHFVTTVSPYAQGKRLTINGWWTGPGATGDLRERAIARLDGVEIY